MEGRARSRPSFRSILGRHTVPRGIRESSEQFLFSQVFLLHEAVIGDYGPNPSKGTIGRFNCAEPGRNFVRDVEV